MDEFSVGRRLRQLRTSRSLTLKDVAMRTGFTEGYVSKVEAGRSDPPISSLVKFANALDIPVGHLFEVNEGDPDIVLVRKGERRPIVRDGSLFGYSYEAIAHKKKRKHMEPLIITLPPLSRDKRMLDHKGEEMFFVLEGTVEFTYDDRRFRLEEGDCIYFDSSKPHRGDGVGDRPARALVVIYLPENV